MKCHWTGIAEIAVAVPLLAAGVLLFISKRKESRMVLSVLAAVLGLFAVLLPSMLIGVCTGPMLCNLVMSPVLILCGILAMVAGVIALMLAVRQKEMAL